jgi:sulfatase maturation enzyme AslB (radical SAM superfamily)
LQLLTTLKCNLKCTYCSLGVGDVLGSQNHVEYTVDELAAFVDKHLTGKEVYVTFYGGEPTLNLDMMLEVMQRFPLFRFQRRPTARCSTTFPTGRLAGCPTSWFPSTAARRPPMAIAAAASTGRC